MSLDDIPVYPMPAWLKVLIVVCCLPVLAFPWLLELCPPTGEAKMLLWLYPAFTVLAAIFAWKAYGRRPEITWVLLFIMLLTHAGMWLLVDPTILLP